MIKALMVDVDGVIVRGRPDDGLPWSTKLHEDIGIDPAALRSAFFRTHWDEIVLGRARLRDRLAIALAEIAPQVSLDQLVTYWFAQDARLDEKLLTGLSAFRAKGLQLHLATNQDHERADYLWHVLELSRHFDGRQYSAALGCKKPEPSFFETVAMRLGFAPDELLLIDDAEQNVSGAKAAGWEAVLWTGQHPLRDVLAEFDLGTNAEIRETGSDAPVDSPDRRA